MKQLMLLRHAKSDWDVAYGEDHARPLNPRGQRAAAQMGLFLSRLGQTPDAVISSTATRARETLLRAAEAGGFSCPVEHTDELYEASPDSVLERLQRLDSPADRLLLVGHEPTWSLLAGLLVGGANIKLPTAGLVRIDFGGSRWSAVEPAGGVLRWLVTPKLLESIGWPS